MHIRDKTVWLTGASTGIGRALALSLAGEGANLIISARNREKLASLAAACRQKGVSCSVLPFDLSKHAEVARAAAKAQQLAPIDMLINNGGVSQRAAAANTQIKIDRLIMEVNYFSAVQLTKLILPAMMERKSGHIVCISSLLGKFGYPGRSAYAASKHALHGFFDSLRAEQGGNGIGILLVCPGRINTGISVHAMTAKGSAYGSMDEDQARGMPAEKCADRIIRSIKKNKKEVYIGGKELSMIHIRRLFPSVYYKFASKVHSIK